MVRSALIFVPALFGAAAVAVQGNVPAASAGADAPGAASSPAVVKNATSKEEIPGSTSGTVLGREVKDPSGAAVGRIVNVLVDPDGKTRAAVIDFGGFMGVGSRKIAVAWSALHFPPGDAKIPATLDMTADQIKAAPEYKGADKAVTVVAPAAHNQPGTVGAVQPALAGH